MPTLEWFATLGVGGVLAFGMFLFYRFDKNKQIEDYKNQNAQAVQVLDKVLDIVVENTEALTKLTAVVESFHRRLDSSGIQEGYRNRMGQPS